MGILKSQSDIRYFKEAGRVAATVCQALIDAARPGVSTVGLEVMANRLLSQHRSTAPFKGFEGFGHAICVSLNEEIVNGPPSRERILQEGDLVSIAVGAEIRGLYGKVARTVMLGEPTDDVKRLLEGTRSVIGRTIERASGVRTLNELLQAVPETAAEFGLSQIEGTGGAGIGKKLHEWPAIPNDPARLPQEIPLVPGFAFVLMPMFSLGAPGPYRVHADGWTHVTPDGALSAHFADTLLITDHGLENVTDHP